MTGERQVLFILPSGTKVVRKGVPVKTVDQLLVWCRHQFSLSEHIGIEYWERDFEEFLPLDAQGWPAVVGKERPLKLRINIVEPVSPKHQRKLSSKERKEKRKQARAKTLSTPTGKQRGLRRLSRVLASKAERRASALSSSDKAERKSKELAKAHAAAAAAVEQTQTDDKHSTPAPPISVGIGKFQKHDNPLNLLLLFEGQVQLKQAGLMTRWTDRTLRLYPNRLELLKPNQRLADQILMLESVKFVTVQAESKNKANNGRRFNVAVGKTSVDSVVALLAPSRLKAQQWVNKLNDGVAVLHGEKPQLAMFPDMPVRALTHGRGPPSRPPSVRTTGSTLGSPGSPSRGSRSSHTRPASAGKSPRLHPRSPSRNSLVVTAAIPVPAIFGRNSGNDISSKSELQRVNVLLNRLEKQLEESRAQLNAKAQEVEEYQAKMSDFLSKEGDNTALVDSVKKQLGQQITAHDKEREQYTATSDEAKAEVQVVQQRLREAEADNEMLMDRVQEAETQTASLRLEMMEHQSNVDQIKLLEERAAIAEARSKMLRGVHDQLEEQRLKTVQQEIAFVQLKEQLLSERGQTFTGELELQNDMLRGKIQQMQEVITALQKPPKSGDGDGRDGNGGSDGKASISDASPELRLLLESQNAQIADLQKAKDLLKSKLREKINQIQAGANGGGDDAGLNAKLQKQTMQLEELTKSQLELEEMIDQQDVDLTALQIENKKLTQSLARQKNRSPFSLGAPSRTMSPLVSCKSEAEPVAEAELDSRVVALSEELQQEKDLREEVEQRADDHAAVATALGNDLKRLRDAWRPLDQPMAERLAYLELLDKEKTGSCERLALLETAQVRLKQLLKELEAGQGLNDSTPSKREAEAAERIQHLTSELSQLQQECRGLKQQQQRNKDSSTPTSPSKGKIKGKADKGTSKWKQKVADLQAKLDRLVQDKEALTEAKKKIASEKKELETQFQEARDGIKLLRGQARRLQADKMSLEDSIRLLEHGDIEELRQTVKGLEKELKHRESEVVRLERRLEEEGEMDVKQLRQLVVEYEERHRDLEESAEQVVGELQHEVAELKQQLKDVERSAEDVIEDISRQKDALQVQLDALA